MVADGLARPTVNRRTGRIRHVFKWAASEELVPGSVWHSLQAVAGLKRGCTEAAEPDKIPPAPDDDVAKTLPFLRPEGCRHGGTPTPDGHAAGRSLQAEAAGRGPLGSGLALQAAAPQDGVAGQGASRADRAEAQALLLPWLEGRDPEAWVFSPREAVARLRAERKARRKSKPTPSEKLRKRKAKPKRQAAERYTTMGYGTAVKRACKKAGVTPWAPNQLRHAFATEVRKRFGLEAAQVLLGHARADVTQVYAERDLTLADQAAAQVG